MTQTLADLGEAELLRRLARFAPPGQLDDDTAQLQQPSADLLINTDVLVESIHFSDATTASADVGWRAVAANLSDLAASGVDQILGITVGLVAPGHTPWSWVEGVYRGIDSLLEVSGGVLLGGDCSQGPVRMISITAIGTLGPLRLHRSQARPGDWIVVSGAHGLSRLGLALLLEDPSLLGVTLPSALKEQAIRQHQRPQPKLDALKLLVTCKPEELPWRAGGTDSSDGLLQAIDCLCRSSGCGAVLDKTKLPQACGWPDGPHWQRWCLSGGEDFELVVTLPPAWAKAWIDLQPSSRQVGVITDQAEAIVWSDDNAPVVSEGFAHYRAS